MKSTEKLEIKRHCSRVRKRQKLLVLLKFLKIGP